MNEVGYFGNEASDGRAAWRTPHHASAHALTAPGERGGAQAGPQLRPPEEVVSYFGVGGRPVLLTQVQPQLTLVPKMQAAGVAVVRLLPRVDANVAFEGLQMAEAGSAGGARVGLLSRVDEHMRAEVCHLNEPRAARLTLVRLLSGVDAAVRLEVSRAVEARSADGAAVRLFS